MPHRELYSKIAFLLLVYIYLVTIVVITLVSQCRTFHIHCKIDGWTTDGIVGRAFTLSQLGMPTQPAIPQGVGKMCSNLMCLGYGVNGISRGRGSGW